jgi:FKBP-type peptidyl-prolyl cis-trans isomerase
MKIGLVLLALALLVSLVAAANMEKYNLRKGKEFLEQKVLEEGVVALPSGLLYKVVTEGPADGKSPSAADTVSVHYRGTLIDGTEFDSSYKRGQPAQFGVGQVIKGWTEALQLMSVGDKWELYIPSDLAYGPSGPGSIGPNQVLIFEVELLDIVGGSSAQPAAGGGKKARKSKKKQAKEEL